MFSYKPLWKKLIDIDINKTTLAQKCKMSYTTIAKMNKNQYIDMKNLDKICNYLHCPIEDIIEHIPDNN